MGQTMVVVRVSGSWKSMVISLREILPTLLQVGFHTLIRWLGSANLQPEVVEQQMAHHFIGSMPPGYGTHLGIIDLTLEQSQKIAVAQIVLKKCPYHFTR